MDDDKADVEKMRDTVRRLRERYKNGTLEEVLFPDNPDLKRLMRDLKSGTSVAERKERADGSKTEEE